MTLQKFTKRLSLLVSTENALHFEGVYLAANVYEGEQGFPLIQSYDAWLESYKAWETLMALHGRVISRSSLDNIMPSTQTH